MSTVQRQAHLYKIPNFTRIIQDILNFFETTPTYPLTFSERFHGVGVYGIYCQAKSGIYHPFSRLNQANYQYPIDIGKAVPKGWRQARQNIASSTKQYELHHRLREHYRSITMAQNLDVSDYFFRFILLEGQERDLISTIEAALIRQYTPLWNTVIDGFGNHDPGRGRYAQAKSDWDVCHPGRVWADRCQGIPHSQNDLHRKISDFFDTIDRNER
jgi:hypothetical protein